MFPRQVIEAAQHYADLNQRPVYLTSDNGRPGFTIYPPADPESAKRPGLVFIENGRINPNTLDQAPV